MKTWFSSLFKISRPIDNWRFEIVFEENELIAFIQQPKHHQEMKETIIKIGTALENARKYLETRIFHCYLDGTLESGNMINGLPLYEVEIDLLKFGNYANLCRLDQFKSIGRLKESEQCLKTMDWKVHGHRKDCPSGIFTLGLDNNGLFLSELGGKSRSLSNKSN